MLFAGQASPLILAGIALLLLCGVFVLVWQRAELKKARQEALAARRQTADMDWAYTSAPLGLAMFDKDLRYIRVNKRLADFNGRSMEDHIGRSIPEVVPEVAPQAEEPFRQVLRSGKPLLGLVFETTTIGDPDVVRCWRESVYPIFSASGEVIGLNVAVEEITEERRLSAALRSSEQRDRERATELEAIMDATPAGIFIARDPQCLHVAGNPEAYRLLRLEPGINFSADPSNRTKLSVYAEAEDGTPVPAHELPMQVAAATGEAVRGRELIYRMPDGDVVHALINAAPLRNELGQVTGAVGAFIDVTAQKQAQQALQQDSRRKDEFLATLAHELRNPLAAIQSGLEVIRIAPPASAAAAGTGAVMQRQLGHLTRLIDDLLDVSRIRSGKFELKTETLDLRTVIEDALGVSRAYVESCRHSLKVNLCAEALFVEGDAVRLAQVVNNLLNNAAKYTPEGGSIALTLERRADDAVIEVSDNGIGFDTEQMPQLFNIYSQLEKGKERRQGGIGIGLSLAKRIVDLHGGILTAHSAGPGKGSRFTVCLPLNGSAGRASAAGATAATAAAGPRRILVVDDNMDAAHTLCALLELAGHDIKPAYTGRDAIDAALSFTPEIAFLDIGLPDMTGYALAAALRAEPALENIRLVALTGWGSEKDRLASLEAGFDFHLTKPATLDAISAILPDVGLPSAEQEPGSSSDWV